MKFIAVIFFLVCINGAFAQSYCDNLVFESIHYDPFNESLIYLVLNHNGSNELSSDSDYASILLITDEEDTLTSRFLTYEYSLPEVTNEKIIYPINIFEGYESYKEFPDEFNARIEFFIPECTLDISYSNPKVSYPNDAKTECSDYRLLDIIKERSSHNKYAQAVIYSAVKDSNLLATGYTSFEFFDNNDESMSYNTGPHNFLPIFPSDTFGYTLQFKTFLTEPLCGYIKTEFPSCLFPYCAVVDEVNEIETAHLTIYPNPTSEVLILDSDEEIEYTKVIGVDGKELIKTLGESPIQVNHLPDGVYYVLVRFENGEELVRKFVHKS